MAAAQMAGDGKTAIAAAKKLARVVTPDAARTIPWVQPIQAAPYFAHAQFSAPETVWALRDPGSSLPYVQAMWHYARGVAYASRKDIQAAERAAAAIAGIAARADFSALTAGGIPAGDVLALARHVLRARIAQAGGALKAARAELERAVAIQDKLSYRSRRTGTIRCASRSAPCSCSRAISPAPRMHSGRACARRLTTAGRSMASRKSTSGGVTNTKHVSPRDGWQRPGPAIAQGSISPAYKKTPRVARGF